MITSRQTDNTICHHSCNHSLGNSIDFIPPSNWIPLPTSSVSLLLLVWAWLCNADSCGYSTILCRRHDLLNLYSSPMTETLTSHAVHLRKRHWTCHGLYVGLDDVGAILPGRTVVSSFQAGVDEHSVRIAYSCQSNQTLRIRRSDCVNFKKMIAKAEYLVIVVERLTRITFNGAIYLANSLRLAIFTRFIWRLVLSGDRYR